MDKIKLLLLLLVLLLAVIGAFVLFGLLAAAFQYLLWIGVIALVLGAAYKLLKGSDRPQPELTGIDWELEKADRLLEEMRRKQLTK